MNYLTPIERMIIESLNLSKKNLNQIARDLEIKKDSLFFVLQRLVVSDLIIYHDTFYSINENKKSDLILKLKDNNSKKFEVKSILESAKHQYIEHQNNTTLQFKKVYLNAQDQAFIQSLFSQMHKLLSQRENYHSSRPLAQKKIFYWGTQCYNDVLKYLEFC